MGIRVDIFRPAFGDCSNGGISSKVKTVTLVDADGPFQPDAAAPAVMLIVRNLFGERYVHAVPVELHRSGKWAMFGGTFIHSSDGRFGEAVSKLTGHRHTYPIALHDRTETDTSMGD